MCAVRTRFRLSKPHHLIPEELADHPLLKDIGFKMNYASNEIMLPNKANKYTSYHRGYHSWYNKAVEAELDYINAKYTTRTNKVRAVENLQRSLDRALRIKQMPLYATSKGKPTKLKPTIWSRYIKSSRKC